VFGSADIITGKVHYTIEEKLNKASFLNHIRQLQKRYSDKEIVIVMDNHRTHRVRELEKIEKVKPYYLLPYSPDLNVIERLWKWLRERITHNFFFETLEELKKSIRNFFSYIANIKEQVALRLQFKV
jgi:transposase